jgi:hypothetical protein
MGAVADPRRARGQQLQTGRFDAARDSSTTARDLNIKLGNRHGIVNCTSGLGVLAGLSRHWMGTSMLPISGLVQPMICHEINNAMGIAWVLGALGESAPTARTA